MNLYPYIKLVQIINFIIGNTKYLNILDNNTELYTPDIYLSFIDLIQYSLVLLHEIYTISVAILVGKDTGINPSLINKYFTYDLCKKYYNIYYSVIYSKSLYISK